MKAETNVISIIALVAAAVAGALLVAILPNIISPPAAETVHEALPPLVIEEVTPKGEVYVRNQGTRPATIDVVYVKDKDNGALYTRSLTPPLIIPPGEVKKTYLPNAPLPPETPITVTVAGRGGGQGSSPALYYPPYGGWLNLVGYTTGSTSPNIRVQGMGLLGHGTYAATGYFKGTGLLPATGTPGRLIVYQASGKISPTLYKVEINSTTLNLTAVTSAWRVGGSMLLATQGADAQGNRHALLSVFPLPLSPGSSTASVEIQLGSSPAGAKNNAVTKVFSLNATHALVMGRLNNTAGGLHDAFIAIVSPTASSTTLDYFLSLGYWDAEGNPADGETVVDAALVGDLLYVLGHGGVGEPVNQGTQAFLVVFNTTSDSIVGAVLFGSPPTVNVTAVSLLLHGDSVYALMRTESGLASYDTLVAKLRKATLEPDWVRTLDFTVGESPLIITLTDTGLRLLIASGSSIILASLDQGTGELLGAWRVSLGGINENYSFQAAVRNTEGLVGVGGKYVFSNSLTRVAFVVGEINTVVPGRISLGGADSLAYEPVTAAASNFPHYENAAGGFLWSHVGGVAAADPVVISQ